MALTTLTIAHATEIYKHDNENSGHTSPTSVPGSHELVFFETVTLGLKVYQYNDIMAI